MGHLSLSQSKLVMTEGEGTLCISLPLHHRHRRGDLKIADPWPLSSRPHASLSLEELTKAALKGHNT